MSIESRKDLREMFLKVWRHKDAPQQLSSLEQQLLTVLLAHPEYHAIFDDPERVDEDYRTDNNPFLHMSLHLGLMEQLSTQRPAGINQIYETLCKRLGDVHQVQHLLMEKMAETIWDAQQAGQMPDERVYLDKIRRLISS